MSLVACPITIITMKVLVTYLFTLTSSSQQQHPAAPSSHRRPSSSSVLRRCSPDHDPILPHHITHFPVRLKDKSSSSSFQLTTSRSREKQTQEGQKEAMDEFGCNTYPQNICSSLYIQDQSFSAILSELNIVWPKIHYVIWAWAVVFILNSEGRYENSNI